ncbi:MAG: right-handed parallel beta-helix repeat-containing protein [Candidatus Omnitrophica bacterium]|nr:right-handed parallel beta-helix repeat-containing protein [Candidatus Omnitrophota bacterium]
MATGVSLFGGFSGLESLEEFHLRDWEANQTIINGGGPVIETAPGTTLDGFVVQNGVSMIPNNAGLCVPADGRILNCTVRENEIGGIRCDNARVEIQNCRVYSNTTGGIELINSDARIWDCRVEDNTSTTGGGLRVRDSKMELRNSQVIGNQGLSSTMARGGGIFAVESVIKLEECLIKNNIAVAGSQFLATSYGGGLYCFLNVDATLSNCVLVGNQSLIGSLMSLGSGSRCELTHCTVTRNTKERGTGSLIHVSGGVTTSFLSLNSIIFDNDVPFSGSDFPESYEVHFSTVDTIWGGQGNINSDPLFVDPNNGDYRLQRGSPCIDSGTDTGLTTDLDGNPRPIGDYDMGAYEFPYLRSDIDGDGRVDENDLFVFQRDWRKGTGP